MKHVTLEEVLVIISTEYTNPTNRLVIVMPGCFLPIAKLQVCMELFQESTQKAKICDANKAF
jgi:hypothetical protein